MNGELLSSSVASTGNGELNFTAMSDDGFIQLVIDSYGSYRVDYTGTAESTGSDYSLLIHVRNIYWTQ